MWVLAVFGLPTAVCRLTCLKCNLFPQKVGDAQVFQYIWNPKIRNCKPPASSALKSKGILRAQVAMNKWPQNDPYPQHRGMFLIIGAIWFSGGTSELLNLTSRFQCKERLNISCWKLYAYEGRHIGASNRLRMVKFMCLAVLGFPKFSELWIHRLRNWNRMFFLGGGCFGNKILIICRRSKKPIKIELFRTGAMWKPRCTNAVNLVNAILRICSRFLGLIRWKCVAVRKHNIMFPINDEICQNFLKIHSFWGCPNKVMQIVFDIVMLWWLSLYGMTDGIIGDRYR